MCFLGGGLIMGVGLLVLLLPLSGGWVVKSPRAFSAVLYGSSGGSGRRKLIRQDPTTLSVGEEHALRSSGSRSRR